MALAILVIDSIPMITHNVYLECTVKANSHTAPTDTDQWRQSLITVSLFQNLTNVESTNAKRCDSLIQQNLMNVAHVSAV